MDAWKYINKQACDRKQKVLAGIHAVNITFPVDFDVYHITSCTAQANFAFLNRKCKYMKAVCILGESSFVYMFISYVRPTENTKETEITKLIIIST